ncbi:methyltransferase [archaeon]|nr:methyltransferase [archaeon]
MGFKQKVAKITGIDAKLIPSGYQIIGDILLLKFMKIKSADKKKKIAEAIVKILPYVKTVCEIREVSGEFREPAVDILFGERTETIHTENGIKYRIDVSKIMFSKGNLTERSRIIPMVKEGENIVDMFAGIGYFSLGLAKFTKAKEILSIEKNPVAYNFFADNIMLNSVKNINAMQGDCAMAAMSIKDYADRIIMGYFPGTEEFLQYALMMAHSPCTIHFHNIYKTKELWTKPLQQIDCACKRAGMIFKIKTKKKVKSYAPRVWHVAVDFVVTKTTEVKAKQ